MDDLEDVEEYVRFSDSEDVIDGARINEIIARREKRVALVLFIAFTQLMIAGFRAAVLSGEEFPEELERGFTQDVVPFLKSYCSNCHGAEKREGQLDLIGFSTVAAAVDRSDVWDVVAEQLVSQKMPPESVSDFPPTEQREAVLKWIHAVRDRKTARVAGDPGIVLARRLSNAEFDHTIRDLTGVDLRPTREFPVDPANEAGFDNSGESLMMSPSLLTKYLATSNDIADHLVLSPKGFIFAPRVLVTDSDRDSFCAQRIIDFYIRHEVDYADYFYAAWEFQHRESLGEPNATLADFASNPRFKLRKSSAFKIRPQLFEDSTAIDSNLPKAPLSTKYLEIIWNALTKSEALGPLAQLQTRWKSFCVRFEEPQLEKSETSKTQVPVGLAEGAAIATPFPQRKMELRQECEQLRDFIIVERLALDTYIEPLQLRGLPIRSVPLISTDSQPLVSWYNQQTASQRRRYTRESNDPLLNSALQRFCLIFPNTFAVTGRQLYLSEPTKAPIIPLSAGFQYQHGFLRDDKPLCDLILDDEERATLDDLWQTLKFVTNSPFRQFKDFLWHDRGEVPSFISGNEFDFARPENTDVTSPSNMDRIQEVYIAKLRKLNAMAPKDVAKAIQAVRKYFAAISAEMRWIERSKVDAQPRHLSSLIEFAERAFRRPLRVDEKRNIFRFYHRLRDDDGLSHEEAIHDSVVSILMSPNFCYRFVNASSGDDMHPLSNYDLASRLSYFLWASMPDRELLASAARGNLHELPVLMTHVRRMVRDSRIRGLATECGGHWLEFRRFEETNTVDRERFPSFTSELRQAMLEEPIRLFIHIASDNRSVLEFLDADYTFVNPLLAAHYEIDSIVDPDPSADNKNAWIRVDRANLFGRGGVLTMSVFLTQNSTGLRTSPVRRGQWVVNRLLGERIPPPPLDVPKLPNDEASVGELTVPQLLARHRNTKSCAACHQRIDPIGVVFEEYGPVGERRGKDLGGRSVDTRATFSDGTEATGVEGLKGYLLRQRREEFVNNLCRKLFSYALGRSLLPSDKYTVDQMCEKLASEGYRFESLVESIVTSPQFLTHRVNNTTKADGIQTSK